MARNSSRAFRRAAALAVANGGGICGICGHGDAITADHIIPFRLWPRDNNGKPLPGLDAADNLRPAHGTRGTAEHNYCYQCDRTKWPHGRLCNQSRSGDQHRRHAADTTEPHSRKW